MVLKKNVDLFVKRIRKTKIGGNCTGKISIYNFKN